MITILPLASSSAGNSYKVTDGKTALLLEAGLTIKELRRALDFRLSDIAGCLISHEHGDHAKGARELLKVGIDLYASAGTFEALHLFDYRTHVIHARQQFTLGTWTIMPFETEHDAAESIGFLLANQQDEKLLFITDSFYCRYTFSGLTHIMIEANFSERILNENIASGRVPAAMKSRLLRSHFSLENVKDFLRANDMSRVQGIWLLHLSDNNSDETEFKREIQALTGKPIMIAKR